MLSYYCVSAVIFGVQKDTFPGPDQTVYKTFTCLLAIKHLADEEELPSLHLIVPARITSESIPD